MNAGSVKVTVTDGAAHPLPGATLTLTGPNGFSAIGTTDGTGIWTFTNVGTGGGYAVTATDGAASGSTSGISVATGVADERAPLSERRNDQGHGRPTARTPCRASP